MEIQTQNPIGYMKLMWQINYAANLSYPFCTCNISPSINIQQLKICCTHFFKVLSLTVSFCSVRYFKLWLYRQLLWFLLLFLPSKRFVFQICTDEFGLVFSVLIWGLTFFFFFLQGKSGASFKDSTLFGVSLSDHVKADFNSSAFRCKVGYKTIIFFCSHVYLFISIEFFDTLKRDITV